MKKEDRKREQEITILVGSATWRGETTTLACPGTSGFGVYI